MVLLPELAALLLGAFEAKSPEDNDPRIFPDFADRSNLRTQALGIIKRAGLDSWEKTFQNLRSSLQTDLNEDFPEHVVNKWMGNSQSVVRKHYLQVTDEHFSRGANRESNWRKNREQISDALASSWDKLLDVAKEHFLPAIIAILGALNETSTTPKEAVPVSNHTPTGSRTPVSRMRT